MYQIIYAAQENKPADEVRPKMNKEELATYESVAKTAREREAKGLPPLIYEIPADAFDDEDYIDNIYDDNFDDEVMKGVNE